MISPLVIKELIALLTEATDTPEMADISVNNASLKALLRWLYIVCESANNPYGYSFSPYDGRNDTILFYPCYVAGRRYL